MLDRFALFDLKLHLHYSLWIREFEGVGQEVDKDLLVAVFVAVDLPEVVFAAADVDELGRNALLVREELESLESCMDGFGEVEVGLV